MWVFQFLVELTVKALREATGARANRRPGCRTTFPRFNIRRLWRLSGRFLKQVLEDLARSLIHIIASSAGYG